jgi:hypothetical protein
MGCIPLTLHNQGLPSLFAGQNDDDPALRGLNVEQDPIDPKESQFTLRNGIRAERLEVP